MDLFYEIVRAGEVSSSTGGLERKEGHEQDGTPWALAVVSKLRENLSSL